MAASWSRATGPRREIFDPADQLFHAAASMADGRDNFALVRLASGRVLAIGGVTSGGQLLASVEVFDPGLNTWTRVQDLPRAGAEMTATLLPSGAVLVAGGVVSGGTPSTDAFLFSESTLSFTPTGSLGTARRGHVATLLNNGMVLATGGTGAAGPTASAEWFDPAAGAWSALPAMGRARAGHSAILLQNGKVLIVGGESSGTIEFFNVVAKLFRSGVSLGFGLSSAALLLMPDQTALIAGGLVGGSSMSIVLFLDEGRMALPALKPGLNAPPGAIPGGATNLSGALFTGFSWVSVAE